MNNPWSDNLRIVIEERNSLVCCGLDPDIRNVPIHYRQFATAEQGIYEFLCRIVELSAEHVCAYKIQKAFFDLYLNGKDILHKLIAFIHRQVPRTPVIVDCKIGDIDNTMEAYFQSILEDLSADGVVLNPYMGTDVWSLLTNYPGKSGLVLVRTSNPSGCVIQDAQLINGNLVWQLVLDLVVDEWKRGNTLIPILSSNSINDLDNIRQILPKDMPIFLAGVGAQGGDLRCVKHLIDSYNGGLMINSSRALLYPYTPMEKNWEEAVKRAIVGMKNSINGMR